MLEDPEKQRQFALQVVEGLRARGFAAYWAGGCVRDRLLGKRPKDYDVATDATPDEIRDVFSHRRTLAIGAAFGVITVVGPRGAGQIEVTTFRQDAAYSDGRHPDAVTFSGPAEDAQRRDFTINGLFFDPVADEVIDYVGGQDDLARRVVRAIGEPRERFAEDKLRMLRAARFAAAFQFELDAATLAAIREMASELTVVSAERIAGELRLILVAESRARGVALLKDTGLLGTLLPEFGPVSSDTSGPNEAATGDAWATIESVLANLNGPSFPLALAALLHAFADGPTTEAIGRRWKLSNKEIARARWLVERHGSLFEAKNMPWPRLQRLLIQEGAGELLALHEAMALAAARDRSDLEYCRLMLGQPASVLDPPPLATGDDLVQIGLAPGKAFQSLLESIRDAQLEERIHTRQEALDLARRLWTELGARDSGLGARE